MNLADAMVCGRSAKGMTQEALSTSSGVPVGTIRGIEQRQVKNPRVVTFVRIVRALELSRPDVLTLLSGY